MIAVRSSNGRWGSTEHWSGCWWSFDVQVIFEGEGWRYRSLPFGSTGSFSWMVSRDGILERMMLSLSASQVRCEMSFWGLLGGTRRERICRFVILDGVDGAPNFGDSKGEGWVAVIEALQSGFEVLPEWGGSPGRPGNTGCKVERVEGIEPSPIAWEAIVVPFNYTRIFLPSRCTKTACPIRTLN